jgi:HEXXH motif-containing protein
LITTHSIPETVFTTLAAGGGGPAGIRHLREAQQSKHLMLLHAVTEAASGSNAAASGVAAFWAGYGLLTRIQALDPGASAWLLGLPHLGGWAHDCLIRLDHGSTPDFAYLACAAAAAAVRAGIPFELDVPVCDGRVQLPGLGSARICDDEPTWVRLCCDGERVTAEGHFEAALHLLVPDDGSGGSVPQWRGTPMVRAVTDGLAWNVLLETGDLYLDRYTLPMSTGLPADDISRWRHRVQDAWQVLVRHHRWAAEPMADGISVIIPLMSQRDTDLVSATTPAAFGAIATSWPPDPVTMAETLVHEFQHVKLGGLMDMVPLVQPGGEKVYAPWRQDPRPAGGLLQGVYAHLGIARFWSAQQHAETEPDDMFRAQTAHARWRSTIDLATHTLLRTGCLTQAGARFVSLIRDQGRDLEFEPVPGSAQEIAKEVALDHWLTWQVRHLAIDAAGTASLAAGYQRGESFAEQVHPDTWIEEETRKVGSAVRSQLLNTRYLAPARYRELCAGGMLPLSEADWLLVGRNAASAVLAYRDEIVGSADPRPNAWIGLALAQHQLPSSPLQMALATHLPLMFDVHTCLGGRVDPLDLAAWFA